MFSKRVKKTPKGRDGWRDGREGGAWHTVSPLPPCTWALDFDAGWEQKKKLKITFLGRSLGFQCLHMEWKNRPTKAVFT